VNNILTIDIPPSLGVTSGVSTFKIVNIMGQEVCRGVIRENKEIVNTTTFSDGIYFLHIQLGDGRSELRKIIKE
jgi:hypothetical protein